MTQLPSPRVSLYEAVASTPEGKLGLDAARLAGDAVQLLNSAQDKAGITSQDLAEAVGVSPSRVSQVLNGDGNVKLSTLARFMGAMGFTVRLECDGIDRPARPSRRGAVKISHQSVEVCYGNSDGVGTRYVQVPNGRDGSPATLLWAGVKGGRFEAAAVSTGRSVKSPSRRLRALGEQPLTPKMRFNQEVVF